MKLLKLVVLGVAIFLGASAIFDKSPDHIRYEISDWFARLGSPDFIVALDSFTSREQAEVLREYKNRGHELTCYGNLRKEEKIGSDTDYLCYTYVSAIYDNIPARLVTFFFTENQLSHIRFELPGSSFEKLQKFLGRKLSAYKRLDLRPEYDFGTDNFGKPLMVWSVKEGIVTTSAEETQGQKVVLLWSSMDT